MDDARGGDNCFYASEAGRDVGIEMVMIDDEVPVCIHKIDT